MKLLEAEITEYTNPVTKYVETTIESMTSSATVGRSEWQPITVKIKQTDENSGIIGKQLQKQIAVFEGEDLFDGKFVIGSDEWLLQSSLIYKFVMELDEWLLEGCWLQGVNYLSYKDDSYIEAIVRFDNATKK